jgi:hypothetical protein
MSRKMKELNPQFDSQGRKRKSQETKPKQKLTWKLNDIQQKQRNLLFFSRLTHIVSHWKACLVSEGETCVSGSSYINLRTVSRGIFNNHSKKRSEFLSFFLPYKSAFVFSKSYSLFLLLFGMCLVKYNKILNQESSSLNAEDYIETDTFAS